MSSEAKPVLKQDLIVIIPLSSTVSRNLIILGGY